jgi:hypothetical protein
MFYARTLSLSIDLRGARAFEFVMAGLDPAIHVFSSAIASSRGCPGQARA